MAISWKELTIINEGLLVFEWHFRLGEGLFQRHNIPVHKKSKKCTQQMKEYALKMNLVYFKQETN